MHQVIDDPKLTAREVRAMRRLNDDDGAVAVVVAVLMVVAMLFAAIVIDVGAVYAERRQLQNGADAAALALARECALTSEDPCVATPARVVMVQSFLDANANDGAAEIAAIDIDVFDAARSTSSTNSIWAVTVEGSTEEADGGDAVPHSFAGIVGIDGTTVERRATAAWGAPASGPVALPLALPTCAFQTATTPPTEIVIPYKDIAKSGGCVDRNGHAMPGNFGWLETSDGECAVFVDTADAETPGQPGNSFPKKECADDLEAMKTEVVMLPMYDVSGEKGSKGWYQIYGFAAFQLTGWSFNGVPSWNANTAPKIDKFGIKGYYTRFVSLDEFELGGVDLGFSAIELVE